MTALRPFIHNVKVVPNQVDAWVDAAQRWGDLSPSDAPSLGEQTEDCRHHLLRVYRVEDDAVWFDHDDLIDFACLEVKRGDPDLLVKLQAWRERIHR